MDIFGMISEYWHYLPTAIAVASVIAKVTPNETDDKLIATLQKIVDIIAMSSAPTKMKDKEK